MALPRLDSIYPGGIHKLVRGDGCVNFHFEMANIWDLPNGTPTGGTLTGLMPETVGKSYTRTKLYALAADKTSQS